MDTGHCVAAAVVLAATRAAIMPRMLPSPRPRRYGSFAATIRLGAYRRGLS